MKRGFGTPQLFAIVFVVLMGFIFVVVAYSHKEVDDPVTHVADFQDSQAHYYLAAILQTPMQNPPESLAEVQLEPTLGDFLVHSKRTAFTQDDALVREKVWENFREEVRVRMAPTGMQYALFFENRGYARAFSNGHSQTSWDFFPCPTGTAEIVLPEKSVVSLEVCDTRARS